MAAGVEPSGINALLGEEVAQEIRATTEAAFAAGHGLYQRWDYAAMQAILAGMSRDGLLNAASELDYLISQAYSHAQSLRTLRDFVYTAARSKQ